MLTSEFVRWTLVRSCGLRAQRRLDDPEFTERLLRPVKAYSDALREGRVFEGVCLDDSSLKDTFQHSGDTNVSGFLVEEALAGFGGQSAVKRECHECPVNVESSLFPGALAGCYGLLPRQITQTNGETKDLSEVFTSAAIELSLSREISLTFLPTTPLWYGLWASSQPNRRQMELQEQLLVHVETWIDSNELRMVLLALRTALNSDYSMVSVLYPRGEVAGGTWRILPYCPRCKAPRSQKLATCETCGLHGKGYPERKRHIQGKRPYTRLANILGEQETLALLSRYKKRCS